MSDSLGFHVCRVCGMVIENSMVAVFLHQARECAERQQENKRRGVELERNRPRCCVHGCLLSATTRLVDRERTLGAGAGLARPGRALLLCDGHAARRWDLDELFDGRIVDRG